MRRQPRWDDYDLYPYDDEDDGTSAARMLGTVLLLLFGLLLLGAGIVIWLRVQNDAIAAAGL